MQVHEIWIINVSCNSFKLGKSNYLHNSYVLIIREGFGPYLARNFFWKRDSLHMLQGWFRGNVISRLSSFAIEVTYFMIDLLRSSVLGILVTIGSDSGFLSVWH